MEREKILTVTLAEAKEWYIKGGEFKDLALKVFSEEELNILPKTWEGCLCIYRASYEGEYIKNESKVASVGISNSPHYLYDKNVLPIGIGKPMLALIQLLLCREVYRNGWKPNWMVNSHKYTIEYNSGDIVQSISKGFSKILSFQSEQVRDTFLNNFKELIEEAKELI